VGHPRVHGPPFLRFYASFPIRHPDGTLAGALAVADTVPRLLPDERLDALAAIARQAEICLELRVRDDNTWRDAIDQLPLGVLVLRLADPADDRTLSVVGGNARGRQMTCDTFETLLGRPLEECFPWARDLGVPPFCARVARTGVAEGMDLQFGPTEGVGAIFAIRAFPLHGQTIGVAFEDVTERRELRRLKAEFVATVSHELRTPLAAIRGSVGLLDGGAAGALPENAARLVGIARAGTERLIRLVNDILDLERLREGPVRGGRITVSALVDAASQAVTGLARDGGVRVHARFGVSGVVPGDPQRLAQALANLLSNAVKFSPRGAVVEVSTHSAGPGWLRIVVRDEGEGLTREQIGRIFQPFQQLDGSDGRAKGGAGLGLAIVRVIAEVHRGRVGVDTAPDGGGAAFWMELPFVDDAPRSPAADGAAAPAAASPRRTRTPGSAPLRALVVDVDPGLRGLVASLLAGLGFAVSEASDGAEAIVHARAHVPDLLVLDIGIPRPDGFEVVDILRDSPAGRAALIVLSARDLPPEERERLRLGPTLHLTKAREDLESLAAFATEVFLAPPG
jgi:signal transduction histidine kinase